MREGENGNSHKDVCHTATQFRTRHLKINEQGNTCQRQQGKGQRLFNQLQPAGIRGGQ